MKRFSCMIISAVLLLQTPIVLADRNEDRRKAQQTQQTTQEQTPNLPAKLAAELDGCLVFKTDSPVVYESGKGKRLDSSVFCEQETVFLPAAATAEFFGKKAVWNREDKSVTIDETVIHPSETSRIVSGRTMIEASCMASYLDAQVLYNDQDTIILGKKALSQEVIDKTVNALLDKFYVIPEKTSGGDGTKENPYGGIQAAILGLRAHTAGGMNTNITVYLHGGLYTNYDPIEFTPADSGKNGFTITYRSYPGETAELAAAEEVKGWKEYKDGIYMARVNAKQDVNIIFENDQFAYKARYPNLGDGVYRDYYLHSAGYNPDNPKTFYFNKEDIPYFTNTNGLQAVFFGGGENGYINWWMEAFNAQIDFRKKSLTLSNTPVRVMGAGSRYFLQGSLELLDHEGEFYYESNSKTIYYMPYNKDINAQTITYATTENPIILAGLADNPIRNIIFEDLKIGKSNTKNEQRAASDPAINFQYAESCAIRNSEILMTGNDAIVFNNTKNCDVSGNYIHDIGAVGVKLDSDWLDGEVRYTGNAFNNNYIKNVGILKRESSGIVLKNVDYGTVMYNHVESTPRMAILIGTGYMASSFIGQIKRGKKVTVENQFDFVNCIGNVIAYNDVSDVMTDSQDGGAIYSWGSGKDNQIVNNHVHDTDMHQISNHPTYFPLYNDDSSGYTTYSRNIVDHTQQYGKGQLIAPMFVKSVGNTITNNFLIDNYNVQRSAISTHADIDDPGNNNLCLNNLTMNSGDRLHGQYSWKSDRFRQCDYNFYYNDSGKYLIYGIDIAKNFDEWQKMPTDHGYMDTHSIAGENPNFVDYERRDYRLRYDSDAYRVGVSDIDEKNIGVQENFCFGDKEEAVKKLYLETDSDGLSANVRLNSGEQTQVKVSARTVSGYFANLENAKITYTSEKPEVAAIDGNGRITAGESGVSEITVTAEKNGTSVLSKLFVLVNDTMDALDVTVGSSILDTGTSTNVFGVGKSRMGYAIPLSKAVYTSSDERVATVDQEGNITAVGSGKAKITVIGTYKNTTQSADAEITVLNGVLERIDLKAEKTDAILVGETVSLDYQAYLSTGENVLNNSIHASYLSGDENIIRVDENGNMTGVSEGRTTVTISLEKDGFGKTQTIPVSVFEKYSGTLADGYKEINFGKSHGYADFREDGTVLMRSTGVDFYGTEDDGYYLYRDITNENVTLEMKVNSLLQTSTNAAVGLTVRESATPESKNYTIRTLRGGTVISVWRTENGGGSGYTEHGAGKYPLRLKLVKKGTLITSYVDFGKGYQEAYSMKLNVGSKYTVGLPMFSQYDLSTEAVISDLSITEGVTE